MIDWPDERADLADHWIIAGLRPGQEEDFREQFDTSFWGVYNVSRAAIPVLRKLGGGTVVQFSSIGGRAQLAVAEAQAPVSRSADFGPEYPADFPPQGGTASAP